jgi:hypothetical protein
MFSPSIWWIGFKMNQSGFEVLVVSPKIFVRLLSLQASVTVTQGPKFAPNTASSGANFSKALKRLPRGHADAVSAANCWKAVIPFAAS